MATIMQAYLGIDISKDTFDAFLTQENRSTPFQTSNNQVGYEKLSKWLKKHGGSNVHACMEATGRYGDELAEFLHKEGLTVSVVNPRRIASYAASQLKRNKTDSLDAAVIADFCRTQNPDPWQPPPPAIRDLQMMTRHLESLLDMRTEERNRLQSGVTAPAVVKAIEQHITFLNTQIADLERQIADHLDQHPDLKQQRDLLVSIPGIGDTTAAKLIAEIKDINRFDDATQLAAYAGLCPSRRTSGTSVRHKPKLSKIGNAVLRKALYFPALSAKSHNPLVHSFCERLAEQKKPKMVVVAAAMRKLLHIVFGVLKHRKPFDPDYLKLVELSALRR
ncbi:MAG: transposase [Anaerolineae bacterium]